MKKQFSIALAAMLVCTALCSCGSKKEVLHEQTITVATDSLKGDFTVVVAAAEGEVVAAPVREASGLSQGMVYDCFGGDGNVMPILGYWSNPREMTLNGQYFPSMKTDAYFASVKESGVNLLIQTNDNAVEFPYDVEDTLTYCDKYELGYYVTDKSLFNEGWVGTDESLSTKLDEYGAHPSFAGFYLKDEPFSGTENSMATACQKFYSTAKSKNMNIHVYLNMNPYSASTFGTSTALKKQGYASYLNTLYSTAEAIPMIAWDVYTLYDDSSFGYEKFYTNLDLVYKAAKDNNKAIAPYVSVSGEQGYKMPNEGELAFQVNTYLAFGAKSIYYFPMNSPLSFSEYVLAGETVAMYDYFGNKTAVWYYVKEANKQIQAIDEYLMNATHEGVIATGVDSTHTGYLATSGSIITSYSDLSSVSGDPSLVGCFNYGGKSCFYVTNYNMTAKKSVTLTLTSNSNVEIIQRGTSVSTKAKTITLNLAAGEGALVRLK